MRVVWCPDLETIFADVLSIVQECLQWGSIGTVGVLDGESVLVICFGIARDKCLGHIVAKVEERAIGAE